VKIIEYLKKKNIFVLSNKYCFFDMLREKEQDINNDG